MAYAFSYQRFIGLFENDAEVAKFGHISDAQYERWKAKLAIPNADLIDSTNPLDEPLSKPVKRYGSFTPAEVREYREKAKKVPHVFNPLDDDSKAAK